MKSVLIFLVSFLTTISAFGQTFEGRITYQNSYKTKLPNVTDQQWGDMMGTIQEYYIKGGDYKSNMNGKLVQWQLFRHQDSKMYTKMSNATAALWTDSSVNPDEILKMEVNKAATEILGYKCDELILTCKSGVQKYYYNSKLGIDPKLFANHAFGNWYEFVKKSNAVPLKIVIDSPQFAMEAVATEVKAMKLDTKLFELPAGMTTEKSPY